MTITAFASRRNFDDFDAFVAAMDRSGGTIVPMAAGPWRATLATVGLGGMQLHWAQVPPQVRQGAAAPGDVLLTSRAAAGSLLHLGHEVTRGEIALLGDGAPIDTRIRQPTVWTGVQFAPGGLATLAEAWTPALPTAGRHAIFRLPEADQQALMAAIEVGIAEATRSPDLIESPVAVAALREAVMVAVARALAGPSAWVEQKRATAVHQRLARGAVDAMAASPAWTCTIPDLSAALGVAPRTLHAAFAAVYGCSPHAYLKRWRLAKVRRVLQARGEAALVKTIALDHGFWHLGHFARDYHAMFGEHPRETRRMATARGTVGAGWSLASNGGPETGRPDAHGVGGLL